MRTVTVAIADIDRDRRAGYERMLEGELGITLLTNNEMNIKDSDIHAIANRRIRQRNKISALENEVARIKRLKPHVMLVNLDMSADMGHALLLSVRDVCPDSHIVLLADDSVTDNTILQALKIGARGYLKKETAHQHLSRAIKVVGQGQAWVPRKMLGYIMDHMMNWKVRILSGDISCSRVTH